MANSAVEGNVIGGLKRKLSVRISSILVFQLRKANLHAIHIINRNVRSVFDS
jgi:hypothetical protein